MSTWKVTFIGAVCIECDLRTDEMANEKLREWKLPRFETENGVAS